MPLPIDVGKAVVWGGRPNSFCGLSFHLSHHGTESMLLKKLSDVVKETLAKMVKEIEGGKELVEAPLPLVLGCQEPIAEWKIPNMRGIMSARTKPLSVVEPVSQVTQAEATGYQLPPAKGAVKLVDKDQVAELVKLLKNEAKVL